MSDNDGTGPVATWKGGLTPEADRALVREHLFSDASPFGIVVHSEGKVFMANPEAARLMRVETPEAVVGTPVMDYVHPEHVGVATQRVAALYAGKGPQPMQEMRLVRSDGSSFWAETTGGALEVDGKMAVVLMFRDITSRREAQHALQTSQSRLLAIADNALDSIFCKDLSRRYTFVNRAMCELFGGVPPEALLGKTPEELFDEESAPVVREVDDRVFAGDAADQVRTITVAGEKRTFHTVQVPLRDSEGRITGVSGIVRDITSQRRMELERKKLEEKFVRAQKMEAIGRLAGGIAHDFNNLLTGISGNMALAMPHVAETHPAFAALSNIRELLNSGERLARQLLTFSRKQVVSVEVVSLDKRLFEVNEMLSRIIGEDVRIEIRVTGPVRPVLVDPGQLDQVLINLVVNARDAMPDGGSIVISVKDVVLEDFTSANGVQLASGDYVEISVTDTGEGIAPEIMPMIFEPFFTTKPMERGTGLGLATVSGIVAEHGGCVEAVSVPGEGSNFRVLLPAASHADAAGAGATPKSSSTPHGSELVLCVEDDAAVREVTAGMLESFGYEVLSAAGGRQALELFDEYGDRIQLVLTDVVMPDMNGMELWRKLNRMRDGVKVIFTSGYPKNILDSDGRQDRAIDFLPKPYAPEKLAGLVRAVLDGADSTCDRP